MEVKLGGLTISGDESEILILFMYLLQGSEYTYFHSKVEDTWNTQIAPQISTNTSEIADHDWVEEYQISRRME